MPSIFDISWRDIVEDSANSVRRVTAISQEIEASLTRLSEAMRQAGISQEQLASVVNSGPPSFGYRVELPGPPLEGVPYSEFNALVQQTAATRATATIEVEACSRCHEPAFDYDPLENGLHQSCQ